MKSILLTKTKIFPLLLSIISLPVLSDLPKIDSYFYYELNGAGKVSVPPSPITSSLTVSLQANSNLLKCGSFDPMVSISNSLNQIRDGIDGWLNQIEFAASQAIVALPGLILQKARPDLYNLMQNGLLRASAKFTLSTKTCEQIVHEFNNGIDPFEKWITLSDGQGWKESMGISSGLDINQVKENMDRNRGNNGVNWINSQKCGGLNQEPCNVISDLVKAGSNILLGRQLRDESSFSSVPSSSSSSTSSGSSSGLIPSIAEKFESPNDIKRFTDEVVGDVIITTCDDATCAKGSRPGKGLTKYIYDRKTFIELRLIDLVQKRTVPSRSNLEEINSPGMKISPQLIESLQTINDDYERGAVISKLSDELATSESITKSLLVLRAFYAAKKEGNIQGNEMALSITNDAITELKDELDNIMYEVNIKNNLVNTTALKLLKRSAAIEQHSEFIPGSRRDDGNPLRGGRVLP